MSGPSLSHIRPPSVTPTPPATYGRRDSSTTPSHKGNPVLDWLHSVKLYSTSCAPEDSESLTHCVQCAPETDTNADLKQIIALVKTAAQGKSYDKQDLATKIQAQIELLETSPETPLPIPPSPVSFVKSNSP